MNIYAFKNEYIHKKSKMFLLVELKFENENGNNI